MLDPLTERVDDLSKSCHERYNQLRTVIKKQNFNKKKKN